MTNRKKQRESGSRQQPVLSGRRRVQDPLVSESACCQRAMTVISDWLLQGMVMVSPKMNPTICCQFEAAIVLLFHAKTFRRGSQVTVHVGNVRQTATVECLHGKVGTSQKRCGWIAILWLFVCNCVCVAAGRAAHR